MIKNFPLFIISQLFSATGEFSYLVALSWWILDTTESPLILSKIMTISLIAKLLSISVIGPLGDVYSKKKIILSLEFLRIIMIIVFIYFIVNRVHNVGLLIGITSLIAIGSPIYSGILFSIIPDIMQKQQLEKAFQYLNIVLSTGVLIGGSLGGIFISKYDELFIFIYSAVLFSISSLFIFFIKETRQNHNISVNWLSFFSKIVTGFKYVCARGHLIWLVICTTYISFVYSGVTYLLPVLIKNIFSHSAATLGFTEGAIGAGSIIGAIIVLSLSKIIKKHLVVLIGLFTLSSGIGALYYGINKAFLIAGGISIGTGLMIFDVPIITHMNLIVADAYRSRVIALNKFFVLITSSLGIYSMGIAISFWNPSELVIMLSSGIFLLTLLFPVIPLKLKES